MSADGACQPILGPYREVRHSTTPQDLTVANPVVGLELFKDLRRLICAASWTDRYWLKALISRG